MSLTSTPLTNQQLPSPVYIKPIRQIVGIGTAGPSSSGQNVGGIIKATSAVKTTTISADAVIEERHSDELVMTDNPVAQGAVITDHAYLLPAQLDLVYAWSAGSPQNVNQDFDFLKTLYQQFLGLYASKTICQVFTGKRLYQNMLVKSVLETTDKDTENSLILRVTMRELIIATTQTVNSTSADVQQQPENTAPVINQGSQSLQSAPSFNGIGVDPNTGELLPAGETPPTPFSVPLTNTPQTLGITLGGIQRNLRVVWNQVNSAWTIDIADAANNPIVQGIPMVTGVDLLEQFGYLGLGAQLVAQTVNDPTAVPTFANLGQTSNLYFLVKNL